MLLSPIEIRGHDKVLMNCCKKRGMNRNIINDYEHQVEKIVHFLKENGYTDLSIGVSYDRQFYDRHPIAPCTIAKDKSSSYLLTIRGKPPRSGQLCEIVHFILMIGSKWCRTYGMSQYEKHSIGECGTDLAGYFIKDGTEYFMLSHIKNTHNEIQTQEIKKKGPKRQFRTTHKSFDRNMNSSMATITEAESIFIEATHIIKKIEVIELYYVLYCYIINGKTEIDFSDTEIPTTKPSKSKFEEFVREIIRNNSMDFYRYITIYFNFSPPEGTFKKFFSSENIQAIEEEYFEISQSPYKEPSRSNFSLSLINHFFPGTKSLYDKVNILSKILIEFILTSQGIYKPRDINDFALKSALTPGRKIHQDITRILRRVIAAGTYTISTPYTKPEDTPKESYPMYIETLDRMTSTRLNSDVQKLAVPSPAMTPEIKTRSVHPSHQNYQCPVETPQGETCGLRSHYACTSFITHERSSKKIIKMIQKCSVDEDAQDLVHVSVNLLPIRKIQHSDLISIRNKLKRDMNFFDVSVVPRVQTTKGVEKITGYDIYCDGGRFSCPLYVVKDGKLLIEEAKDDSLYDKDVDELVKDGYIEYIVANERDRFQFAMGPRYFNEMKESKRLKITHCDIHPCCQFGSSVNCGPLANFNPPVRINHQSAMSKQAITGLNTNWKNRMDTGHKRLLTPNNPLVTTIFHDHVGFNLLPNGFTAVICLQARKRNNEDSFEVFDDFIRTHGNISYLPTISVQLNRAGSLHGLCERATATKGIDRFHAIDHKTGEPLIGKTVKGGDCIFARYSKNATGQNEDDSVYCDVNQEGIIDHVKVMPGEAGTSYLKITIRDDRVQKTGDKIAIRFSQKGTLGSVFTRDDAPRIVEGPNKGVIPDLIVNPKSISSRATGGVPVELILSKAAILTGKQVNGTVYHVTQEMIEEAKDVLEAHGLARDGTELFELPNGERVRMIVGPCYIQALAHHAEDKLKVNGITPKIEPATHQPNKGGPRGALRMGNMEEAAIRGHSGAYAHNSIFRDSSDPFMVNVCTKCNIMVEFPKDDTDERFFCRMCNSSEHIGVVRGSYAGVLFQRHMASAGMTVNIYTEEIDPNVI